jgi:hypothetical protein
MHFSLCKQDSTEVVLLASFHFHSAIQSDELYSPEVLAGPQSESVK